MTAATARRLPAAYSLVVGVLVVGRAWVTDDAYITFRVVQQLVAGHGPVFNAGERVQAYTHPLWFLLLSVWGVVRVDPYYAAVTMGLACAVGVAYLLARTLPPLSATLVIAALATSPSFLDFSTSGLEGSLTH